jgi:RNA polymerase sigma factor (TIGR02999 family)
MARPQVTQLLERVRNGDTGAKQELYEQVYEQLRGIAHSILPGRANATQATAVVHELYQRFDGRRCENSRHFYSTAAEAMRYLAVDQARRQLAKKRGGDAGHEPLDGVDLPAVSDPSNVLALHEALDLLKRRIDGEPDEERRQVLARRHEVVMLRFFIGLEWAEVAEQVGVSERQAKRDWDAAKEFLRRCLDGNSAAPLGDGKGKEEG